MHFKEDHMRNGQLKPGFNVQIAVESEYIISIQQFPNPADVKTLIPFLEHLKEKLNMTYSNIVADAGYESEQNYTYLEANNQRAFIKPTSYETSKTKAYKQNIGKLENMVYNSKEDTYTCANGKILSVVGTHTKRNRNTKFESVVTTYKCESCEKCPLREKCTKSKDGKQLQVSKEFLRQRKQSLENIKSEEGICLRMNRSIQAEGTFGVIKADHHFRQFLTRGNKQVLTELLLLALSFNIRKFHRKIQDERTGTHLFEKVS